MSRQPVGSEFSDAGVAVAHPSALSVSIYLSPHSGDLTLYKSGSGVVFTLL